MKSRLVIGFEILHKTFHILVCQTSVDLVFLLDGSGSVGSNNFKTVKEFVKKVVDFFNIGEKGTHIAVVQYSSRTVSEFHLTRYYTKSEMKQAVDSIRYQSGWTYTAEALKFLRNNIFTPKAGMRTDAGIPKVLVLLTDGKSQGDPVGPPAEALKKIGISIFSIGVGSGVSISQLNEIASDPDSKYVFQRTFDDLIAGWVDRLSAVSCSGMFIVLKLFLTDHCRLKPLFHSSQKPTRKLAASAFKYCDWMSLIASWVLR